MAFRYLLIPKSNLIFHIRIRVGSFIQTLDYNSVRTSDIIDNLVVDRICGPRLQAEITPPPPPYCYRTITFSRYTHKKSNSSNAYTYFRNHFLAILILQLLFPTCYRRALVNANEFMKTERFFKKDSGSGS